MVLGSNSSSQALTYTKHEADEEESLGWLRMTQHHGPREAGTHFVPPDSEHEGTQQGYQGHTGVTSRCRMWRGKQALRQRQRLARTMTAESRGPREAVATLQGKSPDLPTASQPGQCQGSLHLGSQQKLLRFRNSI